MYDHTYRAALSKIILWALAVLTTLHSVFMPTNLYCGHSLVKSIKIKSCSISRGSSPQKMHITGQSVSIPRHSQTLTKHADLVTLET